MKRTSVRWLSLALAIIMLIGMLPGVFLHAGSTTDYDSFLDNLKVLEGYADTYAASSGKDAGELVINFIRTGVDRYNDGNWKTLAGEEITAFTDYVEAQDAANGTTVMDLRDIVVEDFKLPNGNQVDFGHMFGTLNIAYVASQASADLGGWAGDVCDLFFYSKYDVTVPQGTVDEMAAYILTNCFGVNADDAFGMDDFYGDMDAFYLITELKKGTAELSEIMTAYFTADLTDSDRAAYFLNNRFKGLENAEDVRSAILGTYTANVGLKVLESDRGLSSDNDLRTASCYAFADYLFELAGDRLEGDAGDDDETGDNAYYSVFFSTDSTLAPGITQTIKYAQTADNKQIVYYVATVDVNRDDVTIMANYKDNDPSKGWGMQRVEDQAKALVNKYSATNENFNAIVATNADGYNMSTGKPGGLLVMDGVEWNPVDGDGFFAILKDGSAMIGTKADYDTYKEQIQEAVGGFGATLIKDGEVAINKSSGYYTSRASRTAIGITAEGKVVMMVLDGRQEPFSAGGSMEEIAQIMLDAGCVEAINLDGGGSTTYLSKPEGSDTLQLVNRPSDGYARSVATSLVAVSTAKSSKEFDHANITSDYDYLTIGTSLTLTASGVSNTGYSAPVPEGAIWQVSDATIGTITADGVFTASANGEVEVQLVVNGEVVGSKTLNVVVPDAIEFEKASIMAIYGMPIELPLKLSYNGNTVAYNATDVWVLLENQTAGTLEGFTFTGVEESGIRTVMVGALLLANQELMAFANINMYKADEAYFDFDNATAGNRTLAWLREVNNAVLKNDMLYEIVTPGEDMDLSYTFALDMTAIEIPAQLKDLTYMLPGADAEDASAWNFLLQLAERVSVLTEVKVTAQFDADLEVDISELKVSNEYFYLSSAVLDENNQLTVICNWVDQTAAIDPATANPICILSGIKATPKDGATWDADDQLVITNTGKVSYKIYLRANALYSFASSPANQAQYGLYPFENPDVIIGGATEKGAYFSSEYADFEDSFVLDKTLLQGWQEVGNDLYYYVDHVPVTGIRKLPSYEDPTVSLYYQFDEDGKCLGKYTGLYEENGKLYYAFVGEKKTGWQSVLDPATGESNFYYFEPYRGGYAVTGTNVNCDGFYMTFEDYKLVLGQIVKTADGYKYRYADLWMRNQWIDIDGKRYYIGHDYYLETNGVYKVRNYEGTASEYLLFDETGVWLEDVSGMQTVNNELYIFENGKLTSRNLGLVYIDGYYYYFRSDGSAVKGRSYWITNTNDLLPQASYTFDEFGRMTDAPIEETPDDTGKLNGIVDVNGVLYYYVDGLVARRAGLMKLTDDAGETFYIYVRTEGQLALGKYWPTNTNDLLPYASYDFGTDGKYYPEKPVDPQPPVVDPDQPVEPDEPVVPALKNGVVEENGVYKYYENGNLAYKGLMELTDDEGNVYYIYVRSNGLLAIGKYWPTKHNDVLPLKTYDFGTDGRYYPAPVVEPEPPVVEPEPPVVEPDEPEVLNGIVEVDGVLYYYENGKPVHKGLMQFTDDNGDVYYIYVRTAGNLAIGKYWPTVTNDLLPYACYDFGENGRYYPAD